MTEETADQISSALAFVLGLAGAVWLTWCIVVAFIGGTMPLIGFQTEGSFGTGLFWLFIVSPIAESIFIWAGTLLVMPFYAMASRD